MLPWLAVGAGLAMAKYISDSKREASDRKLRAAEYRAAPYTGQKPTTDISRSDLVGSLMQGGMTGMAMGQNAGALSGAAGGGASPWMSMGGQPQGPSLMPEAYGQNPFGVSSTDELLKSIRS